MGLRGLGVGAVVAALIGTTLVGTSVGATSALAATATPTVSRLAGADRIGTAVAISQHAFPSAFGSGGSVYLARMDVFADAVAAGTLTDGPVLLVPSCASVPQVVKDEVARLTPARVVALGGAGAVCTQVLSEVAAGRATARLAGADRYLTSLEIARERLRQGPVTEVYVASGLDSPDAVVGGQLTRGPILLTGTVDRSADYNTFLDAVKPARVVALGGEGVVADTVLGSLSGAHAFGRLAGTDRYLTAATIAMREFQADAQTVYLARGDVFADGVASGALMDGPVVLVGQCSLPTAAKERIAAARPVKIYALGGPGAICDSVLSQAAAATSISGGRATPITVDETRWPYAPVERSRIAATGGHVALLTSSPTERALAVKDLNTQAVVLASIDPDGKKVSPAQNARFDITADGRYVVFEAYAADYPHQSRIYLRDVTAGSTVVVSRAADGSLPVEESRQAAISTDGSTVVFTSDARLVSSDTNSVEDVYSYSVASGATQLVSATAAGAAGNAASGAADVSGDGRYAVYETAASNLVTPWACCRGIVRTDLRTHESVRVDSYAGTFFSLSGHIPSISDDGSRVAYTWENEVGYRVDQLYVYVRDLNSGQLMKVSQSGSEWGSGYVPALSGDGHRVTFMTRLALDPRDTDQEGSVYLLDLTTSQLRLLSHPYTFVGVKAEPSISSDGSRATFGSALWTDWAAG
jgi:Tol biopolymer transport system component/putative cell wall-binding protein